MRNVTETLLSIGQIVKLYDGLLKRVCAQFGLTAIEAKIVGFLHNNPGRDTAGDIAEVRMLSKSNVSQAVESLIGKGLLRRDRPPPRAPVSAAGGRTGLRRNRRGARHVFRHRVRRVYGGGDRAVRGAERPHCGQYDKSEKGS